MTDNKHSLKIEKTRRGYKASAQGIVGLASLLTWHAFNIVKYLLSALLVWWGVEGGFLPTPSVDWLKTLLY